MRTRLQSLFGWLRLSPEGPRPFAYLRIGVALVLLFKLLREAPGALEIYGNHGFLPWVLNEAGLAPWMPRMSWVADVLHKLFGLGEDTAVIVVIVFYGLSLVGLLVGWKTRFMAAGAWFSHLVLFLGTGLSAYGLDNFANISLFYCMLAPAGGALSLDAWKRPGTGKASIENALYLVLIRLHLSVAYFSSGYIKATGRQWWSGESIWRAVMQPQFHVFPMQWLAYAPWVARGVAWGTIGVELGYIFFIWPRETRKVWVLAAVLMHLGIAITLGLWAFSLIMITLNLVAFGSDIVDFVAAAIVRKFPSGHKPQSELLEGRPAPKENDLSFTPNQREEISALP